MEKLWCKISTWLFYKQLWYTPLYVKVLLKFNNLWRISEVIMRWSTFIRPPRTPSCMLIYHTIGNGVLKTLRTCVSEIINAALYYEDLIEHESCKFDPFDTPWLKLLWCNLKNICVHSIDPLLRHPQILETFKKYDAVVRKCFLQVLDHFWGFFADNPWRFWCKPFILHPNKSLKTLSASLKSDVITPRLSGMLIHKK